MRILTRYVLRDILLTAFLAVSVLSLVLVLGNIFRRLLDLFVNYDVPLEFILRFIGYVLPFSLTFTIPWGFLTAVLLVFGRLSADSELVAVRSTGVSLFRLSLPVIILGALFSLLCLWINLSVAPRAQVEMRNTLFRIATNNPMALFGSDQVIDQFPGKKIYVGHREGDQLQNIQVYHLDAQYRPIRVVVAETGRLEVDLQNQQILMHLGSTAYEERSDADPDDLRLIRQGISLQEGTFPISLEELYKRNEGTRGLSSLTWKELNTEIDTGAETEAAESEARTEINKRFSFSLACFAFGLIGIPLAVTAQRRETSIGFTLSLIVAFSYFFFIILADSQKSNVAAMPHIIVWLPNVIFISLGAWLLWRRNAS